MVLAVEDSWKTALEWAPLGLQPRIRELCSEAILFLDFALDLLERDADQKKRSATSTLLLDSNIIVESVLNCDSAPIPEAIRLAKAAAILDTRFDVNILAAITVDGPTARIARALELIDVISDCQRLTIPLLKFAKSSNPKIRSKAIKLMARGCQNGGWVESIFADPDPRVRCNLVEGIFTHMRSNLGPGAAALLRRASKDPHHRVSTTALLCLAQIGDEASRTALENMTGDGREMHARAATWALKKLKDATPSNTARHPTA
jgi:hypothetical protein